MGTHTFHVKRCAGQELLLVDGCLWPLLNVLLYGNPRASGQVNMLKNPQEKNQTTVMAGLPAGSLNNKVMD